LLPNVIMDPGDLTPVDPLGRLVAEAHPRHYLHPAADIAATSRATGTAPETASLLTGQPFGLKD